MNNITVMAVVYNEESRIENYIKSFSWSNDLIIIDKSSTDKTREIINKYKNCTLITVPYSDTGDEYKYAIEKAKNNWILATTSSELIHPSLVEKLIGLINQPNFEYDVISVPFAIYVLGMRNPKISPWSATTKELLINKSVIRTSKVVHKELYHEGKRIHKMEFEEEENLYHLTHENMNNFLERHIRYAKLEQEKLNITEEVVENNFKELKKVFLSLLIKKRIFFRGIDAAILGVAYLSYFMLKFLFSWEKLTNNGNREYKKIREEILALWEEKDNTK